MTTKVEIITPKIATEILEKHNPRNRNISENTVSAYATDMKNKRWTLTHQGLAFDENGDLIDGQHRLWAVVMSDCEVEFNVTRGIPVKQQKGGIEINSMDNIDRGRTRGTGSQMQLSHGIKNGTQVAAGCRGIAMIISQKDATKRLSFASNMFIYEQYGRDIEQLIEALDGKKRVSHILAPLALYHHGEPDKAIEFCRQLTTLERLSAPARVFIKWLEQKHNKSNVTQTMRVLAKCLHHFHDGTEKLERVTDDDTGLRFLMCMYPSLNKRIADAIKPVAKLKIPRKMN